MGEESECDCHLGFAVDDIDEHSVTVSCPKCGKNSITYYRNRTMNEKIRHLIVKLKAINTDYTTLYTKEVVEETIILLAEIEQ